MKFFIGLSILLLALFPEFAHAFNPPPYHLEECDIGDGFNEALFNLNELQGEILSDNPGVGVAWFENSDVSSEITIPTTYISTSKTIFARVITSSVPFPGGPLIEVELIVLSLPIPEIIGDTTICVGQPSILEVQGGFESSFEWNVPLLNGGSTIISGDQITVDEENEGQIEVQETDTNGCQGKSEVSLQVSNLIETQCVITTLPPQDSSANGIVTVDIANGRPPFQIRVFDEIGNEVIDVDGLGGGEFDVPGIPPGFFLLTIEDDFGCLDTCLFQMEVCTFELIDSLSFATDLVCFNDSTGAIQLEIQGGLSPFIFSSDAVTIDQETLEANMLSAGSYSILVSDSLNCLDSIDFQIIEPPLLQLQNCSTQDAINEFANNGEISFGIEGGTIPYMVVLTGPVLDTLEAFQEGIFSFDSLVVGNYVLTLIDSNECTTTCEVFIDGALCILDVDFTTINVECATEEEGAIDLVVLEGHPPYEFNWSVDSLDGEQNIANLLAGMYSVTVTDSIECEQIVTIEITEPIPLQINCFNATASTIIGENDGIIEVNIEGGTPPYVLEYFGSLNDSIPGLQQGITTIDTLLSGDYSLIVTDSFECSAVCTFTIDEPDCSLYNVNIDSINVSCFEANDGQISLNVQNSKLPITIYGIGLNGDSTFQDSTIIFSGLPAGIYDLIVEDMRRCSIALSVTLEEPEPLILDCSDTTGVSVIGENTGSLNATFAGGNIGLDTLMLEVDGQIPIVEEVQSNGSYLFDNLSAGDYTLTIIDSQGCTDTCNFEITEPNCDDFNLILITSNISCNDASDGSIDLIIENGESPFSIDWSNGQAIEDIDALEKGIYYVTVEDARGCIKLDSAIIEEPLELLVECIVETNVSTIDGTDGIISINISGGTPEYEITIDEIDGTVFSGTTGENLIEDLPAGIYNITVTDDNGCTFSCVVTLNEPDCTLNLTAEVENISCFDAEDGSIILNITGAAGSPQITWNDAQYDNLSSIMPLEPGEYIVTVTDTSSLCVLLDTFIIVQPNPLEISCNAFDVSTIEGNDGQIQISISGGTMPYDSVYIAGLVGAESITSDSFQIEMLPSGTYTVTVIDLNECLDSCIVTINEPDCSNFALDEIAVDSVSCNGGNDGSIQFQIDGSNSLSIDSITLIKDGSEILNLNISQNQDTFQIDVLEAGNYTIIVRDSSLCTDSLSVTIDEPDPIIIAGCNDLMGCNESVTIFISGGNPGYTVSINGPISIGPIDVSENQPILLENLEAGEYTVDVVDVEGCEDISCVFTIPVASSNAPENDNCSDAILVELEAPSSDCPMNEQVSWDYQGNLMCASSTTTTNCGNTDWEVWFNLPALGENFSSLNISLVGDILNPIMSLYATECSDLTNVIGCGDDLLTINSLDINEDYLLSLGGTGDGGEYTIIVTVIYEQEAPNLISQDTVDLCPNLPTILEVEENYVSYLWSTEETTSSIEIFESGGYSITVTDVNDCEFTDFVQVVDLPMAFAGTDEIVEMNSYVLMAEDPNDLGVIGMWEFQLPNFIDDQEVFNPLAAVENLEYCENEFIWTLSNQECGIYSEDNVTIYFIDDSEVITINDTFFITNKMPLFETVNKNGFFQLSDTVITVVDPPVNAINFELEVDGNFTYQPNSDFIGVDSFMYEIYDSDCEVIFDKGTVYIFISSEDEIMTCNNLFFTPGEDDKNSTLFIPELEDNNFPRNRVVVFDNRGQVVYEASPYTNDWDGQYRGNFLPDGAYYYFLWLDQFNDAVCQGYITLLK